MPKGSCLCHEVEYEYRGEPVTMARNRSLANTQHFTYANSQGPCYCLSCRKISGSTNTLNILIPDDKFNIIAGTTKQHTVTHESGKKLTVYFCGQCGSTIYKTHELFPGVVVILTGTLDDTEKFEELKPEVELYVKHRASWLPELTWALQKEEF